MKQCAFPCLVTSTGIQSIDLVCEVCVGVHLNLIEEGPWRWLPRLPLAAVDLELRALRFYSSHARRGLFSIVPIAQLGTKPILASRLLDETSWLFNCPQIGKTIHGDKTRILWDRRDFVSRCLTTSYDSLLEPRPWSFVRGFSPMGTKPVLRLTPFVH